MTVDDENRDPVLRQLSRLPVATPDAVRSERVRARCTAGLARRSVSPGQIASVVGIRPLLGMTLLGGLCVVYLSVVISDALRLYWHS